MKVTLFAMFVALLMVGCGEEDAGKFLASEELNYQASALFAEGKYREAKAKALEAYAAFEAGGAPPAGGRRIRVSHLRLLCNISLQLQENDKAIEYAFEILTHATNEDGKAFANNNLGWAYNEKGEYDKAIGHYERAVAINLKTLGSEHPHIGIIYNNIGSVYADKGDYPKASEYYEKGLAIQLKTLGSEHPGVGISYNNLGSVYGNKGEYDKALGYYEKSLAISLKTLGLEHPEVGISYYNTGTVYAQKGDKPKAMEYLLKAKAIFLKKLGPNHQRVKDAQSWIDKVGVVEVIEANPF